MVKNYVMIITLFKNNVFYETYVQNIQILDKDFFLRYFTFSFHTKFQNPVYLIIYGTSQFGSVTFQVPYSH